MLGCYANNSVAVPTIVVHANCDTCLAIKLNAFKLSDYDEFIFAIKNYDYIDSSCVFLYRARKADMDENGEIIFNIDPDVSKRIKPGAFYNMALLVNAFNYNEPSEYVKLTENGAVTIEYGTHDLALESQEASASLFNEILAARVEIAEKDSGGSANGVIVGIRLDDIVDIDCEG